MADFELSWNQVEEFRLRREVEELYQKSKRLAEFFADIPNSLEPDSEDE